MYMHTIPSPSVKTLGERRVLRYHPAPLPFSKKPNIFIHFLEWYTTLRSPKEPQVRPSPLVHASPARPTLHLHKPARHLEAGGTGYTPLVNSMDFCCEAIRNLPPELPEKILNELIATKIRERVSLGWSRAHFQNLLAAVKIRERNALGWKELHNEFRLKVLEPDWEELERIRDEQYEIVLGEAIEKNVPFIVCHFCQRPQSPISFCNCKKKKKVRRDRLFIPGLFRFFFFFFFFLASTMASKKW